MEEKLIVWFSPKDKKELRNQFHVAASSNKEAINKCMQHATFQLKVLGISKWRNNLKGFEDNTFY